MMPCLNQTFNKALTPTYHQVTPLAFRTYQSNLPKRSEEIWLFRVIRSAYDSRPNILCILPNVGEIAAVTKLTIPVRLDHIIRAAFDGKWPSALITCPKFSNVSRSTGNLI